MLETTSIAEDSARRIEEIIHSPDESSLNQLIRELVLPLGATSHIFTSILRNEGCEGRENHRFLIGCKPQLCQFYNGRKWFMNDPCIIYAKTSTAPVAICDLPITSPSQKRFLHDTFPQWGFKSGIIIPAHSAMTHRMGILYVGSEKESASGNTLLMRHRALLRAIAMELLDWWCVRIRRDALEKFKLSNTDLHILTLTKQGFTSKAIAIELKVSPRTIYDHIKRFKESLGVGSVSETIEIASRYGLIL